MLGTGQMWTICRMCNGFCLPAKLDAKQFWVAYASLQQKGNNGGTGVQELKGSEHVYMARIE